MMDNDHLNRLLEAASQDNQETELTTEQRAANADVMSQLRQESAEALQRRIESKELLSLSEFAEALKVSVQSIDDAVIDGRMFSITAPGGQEFYPAFFADRRLNRIELEVVARVLVGVPAPSKFHFFTSKSTSLGDTPVRALLEGRLENVLTAASAFTER